MILALGPPNAVTTTEGGNSFCNFWIQLALLQLPVHQPYMATIPASCVFIRKQRLQERGGAGAQGGRAP